jgi:single-strand DNA-binding protein
MNVVVLRGTVVRAPEIRELPSDSRLVSFDVRTAGPEGRAETVPVSWADAPAADEEALVEGTEVLVVGRIRRRFFRTGGSTQSRTEVVAERVARARQARRARAALEAAVGAISTAP